MLPRARLQFRPFASAASRRAASISPFISNRVSRASSPARAWSREPGSTDLEQLARTREAKHHDVSAALVEIDAEPSEASDVRATDARELTVLGEVGALRPLRALSAISDAGDLKAAVDATIAELQSRAAYGARDQMRTLPR